MRRPDPLRQFSRPIGSFRTFKRHLTEDNVTRPGVHVNNNNAGITTENRHCVHLVRHALTRHPYVRSNAKGIRMNVRHTIQLRFSQRSSTLRAVGCSTPATRRLLATNFALDRTLQHRANRHHVLNKHVHARMVVNNRVVSHLRRNKVVQRGNPTGAPANRTRRLKRAITRSNTEIADRRQFSLDTIQLVVNRVGVNLIRSTPYTALNNRLTCFVRRNRISNNTNKVKQQNSRRNLNIIHPVLTT